MKRALTKAGRLLVLLRLRQQGSLDGVTLQEIADQFGVNRSTIMRDLREIDQAEAEYQRIKNLQPWGQG